MKRNIYSYILVLAAVLGLAHTAAAQTLNVNVGNVTYAYSAAQVGDVTCAGANQLTILGRTYSVADITDMVVTPKIMGKTMGLNPAILLLSLSVWGALLGFIGLIVALPLTTLLMAYWQRYVTKEHLNDEADCK